MWAEKEFRNLNRLQIFVNLDLSKPRQIAAQNGPNPKPEIRNQKPEARNPNPETRVRMWAEKEFRNLNRLYTSGVRCPKPLLIKSHILVINVGCRV